MRASLIEYPDGSLMQYAGTALPVSPGGHLGTAAEAAAVIVALGGAGGVDGG